MDRHISHLLWSLVFFFAALLPAAAQTPEEFYKGKTLTMLVASGAGGGYDIYARAFARHVGKYLPGKPTIVAKNLPGAGGLIAVNSLSNTAAPDGLTFAALTNGVAMDPLFGENAAKFDPLKLNWLGSIGKLENICITMVGSPITKVEQVQQKEISVAASAASSNSVLIPKLTNAFIGTKFKIVLGYPEGTGNTLALERGEVEGICGLSYSTLKATHPDWFANKRLNIFLQIGLHKIAALPDVPNAIDLVKNAEDKKVLEIILIRQEIGRPFAMPAGVPADRVAAFRKAFDATMKDSEFLAEADRLQMEVDPLSGAEMEKLLAGAYAAPKAVIARAVSFLEPAH